MSSNGSGGWFEADRQPTHVPVHGGSVPPAPPAPVEPAGRRRPGIALAMGIAAALVLTATGVGLCLVAPGTPSMSTRSDTAVSGGTSRFGLGFGNGSGQGYGSTHGNGATGGSMSIGTAAATDRQEAGVVVIDTVLGYEGAEAAGTGIILGSTGEILTNNHVIDGATSITVTIASTGKTYPADVAGTDATEDIALLRLVGASGLTVADVGSSSHVAVGDAVTGVGNAGGTGSLTAAAGTVARLDQSITAQGEGASDAHTLNGVIEIDADIQSGDSGGPLYDANGEVIGIDTAAASGTSSVTGYAIPIETALGIVDEITSGAKSSTVTIGYPAFLGVELDSGSSGRAVVAGVIEGTPAAGAAITAGDTITAIDGSTVSSAADLPRLLRGHAVGASVALTWLDAAGASHGATVTLVAGPAD